MNNIVFKNVVKNYGNVEVVKELDLEIKAGERLILLGPSGCGKSTTLRMIAGLESITQGELFLGEKKANDITPGKRNVAMVFQNYALLPHLTVWDNIAFGLANKKFPKDEIEKRVSEAIGILNLMGLEKRHPKELSGGQRQRVALARGIVKRAPYFLLDEPLSNLDAQLRNFARSEIVKIHEMYKPTLVYVTHDQVEAMTIAERIAIMNGGYLQQVDTPENVYNQPVNTFVAKFLGSPSMNIVDAYVSKGKITLNGKDIIIPMNWLSVLKNGNIDKVKFGVRPEDMSLTHDGKNSIEITIDYIENHGNKKCAYFMLNGESVISTLDSNVSIAAGERLYFDIDWEKVHFFSYNEGISYGYPDNRLEEAKVV